ncbi:hypothetical protein AVEN_76363-1 [Araneus ventricosus]|uniref:Uncharacterized protein n=1 Tax=Araneus ventricosus TaxID=182803 RepID=A0A4Y2KM08_ARAVE|nr:hypothetical protein AVEN_76363-1 [Araneus ventricosus]
MASPSLVRKLQTVHQCRKRFGGWRDISIESCNNDDCSPWSSYRDQKAQLEDPAIKPILEKEAFIGGTTILARNRSENRQLNDTFKATGTHPSGTVFFTTKWESEMQTPIDLILPE